MSVELDKDDPDLRKPPYNQIRGALLNRQSYLCSHLVPFRRNAYRISEKQPKYLRAPPRQNHNRRSISPNLPQKPAHHA